MPKKQVNKAASKVDELTNKVPVLSKVTVEQWAMLILFVAGVVVGALVW